MEIPNVSKSEWMLTNVEEDGMLVMMDDSGHEKIDCKLPDLPEELGPQIRDQFEDGKVLSVCG